MRFQRRLTRKVFRQFARRARDKTHVNDTSAEYYNAERKTVGLPTDADGREDYDRELTDVFAIQQIAG